MKTLKLIKLLCASVCMAFVATGVLYAQSPYGWRGAHRDGIYEETGLLKVWPADGPELLWSALDAGKGHTSPVIVSDRLYITGMNEDETREIFSAYTSPDSRSFTPGTLVSAPAKVCVLLCNFFASMATALKAD